MQNDKIPMTNEIQNPNVQKFSHLSFDIDLTFELWHLTFFRISKDG